MYTHTRVRTSVPHRSSTSTFNIAAHSTPHHIPHRIYHHISRRIVTFHILHYATFHIPGHHIPHTTIFHITHFAFQLQSISRYVWNCNIPHRTTFHNSATSAHHSTSRPHSTSPHTMPRTSPHFKYKLHIPLSHSTHSKPHHTSHAAFQPSFRITPCLILRQTIPHHSVFHNHISHLASQHTTIFHMYHTIIPDRITTFRNASSDIAWHHM